MVVGIITGLISIVMFTIYTIEFAMSDLETLGFSLGWYIIAVAIIAIINGVVMGMSIAGIKNKEHRGKNIAATSANAISLGISALLLLTMLIMQAVITFAY